MGLQNLSTYHLPLYRKLADPWSNTGKGGLWYSLRKPNTTSISMFFPKPRWLEANPQASASIISALKSPSWYIVSQHLELIYKLRDDYLFPGVEVGVAVYEGHYTKYHRTGVYNKCSELISVSGEVGDSIISPSSSKKCQLHPPSSMEK